MADVPNRLQPKYRLVPIFRQAFGGGRSCPSADGHPESMKTTPLLDLHVGDRLPSPFAGPAARGQGKACPYAFSERAALTLGDLRRSGKEPDRWACQDTMHFSGPATVRCMNEAFPLNAWTRPAPAGWAGERAAGRSSQPRRAQKHYSSSSGLYSAHSSFGSQSETVASSPG